MSSLFDSLSEELFQVLKGSGKTLTLYGEDGNKTYEPSQARRVFATPDNLMVSVVEAGNDSEVKLYLSKSTDVEAISGLINTLRQITTRYNVLFNVRKYGRELQPKDFAYQASVTEASMWGTTRTSYQKFGPTKLIVRHCRPVVEGIIGARGRNILGMFVETAQGERFRFPENHLSAGRAFAQHINQGGKPHDTIGTQLTTLAQESLDLARVNRYIQYSKSTLGEEAIALRTPIKARIVELRRAFLAMSRPRGYHKIGESLPLTTANLNEDHSDRISRLQNLLMIDSNHALAESLMPVALLTLGENMTNNDSMFQGVLTLEDAAADALVEALLDEYGYQSDSWARYGSNIAFNENAILEDAREYLNLVESPYQINESDAVMDYATQWTQHRAGGPQTQFDDPKDRKHYEQGIANLASGLRAILSGNFALPDYPESAPQFSRTDPTVKDRFYLDLYVGQNRLIKGGDPKEAAGINDATLNYIGTIIDKLSSGKKLDGAEKTISGKLIKALEDDLGEGIVDEGYYDDDPHYVDPKYEDAIETIVDQFDVVDFVHDIYPTVANGEEQDEPLDTKYVLFNLDAHIAYLLDQSGFQAHKGSFKNQAEELLPQVKSYCEQQGYHFEDQIQEFAEYAEEPRHHGIAVGDNVATDMGPGNVLSSYMVEPRRCTSMIWTRFRVWVASRKRRNSQSGLTALIPRTS
jgi:hypothetical protein